MMAKLVWDPEQYNRFQKERSQPFYDLLAMVRPSKGMNVLDAGCGTGELTSILHSQLGAARTTGVDSSQEMLDKAARFAQVSLTFEKSDIRDFERAPEFDLIFSNAVFHWVPDHAGLFGRLRNALKPAGQIALQMPINDDHVSHRAAAEVALQTPFKEALGGYTRPSYVLSPEEYALLLADLGFESQTVRTQVYLHRLNTRDDIIEWVKGALLRDYEARLSPALFENFLLQYRNVLHASIPDSSPVLYTFKRLLIWASL